ncbi:hypothetical protein DXG03_009550 [Asterophora parasitica]|uniref:Uncharacterized protein n=1 Tax=Asterophora parasitica TaxID=117018 RepID=A0A9P7G668_9AGAR|nr:hypothetical protein DXG03_009550 [Asterophora parasitica]
MRRFRLENPRYPTQIEEILSVMANPAPLLESLELHSLPRKRASILPDNLFGGVAPRLQALDLHGWFLSPDSWHILPTLTTLKMDYLSNLNGGPSLFELIKLLEMAPNIQNLSLSSVHRDTSTPIPDEYTVRLHNLRQLRICDTLSRCTDVIERLRYPILTQFTLRIHSQSGYDNDHYGGYIASLQRIGGLAAACMAPLCSLQLRRESYGVYGLEGWTQRYAHLHAPVDVPNMKIIISCFPDPPTAHDPDKHYFSGSIRAIWEVLPKTNLECIYLEGTIFSRQIFQEAFGDNPSLRTISIADDESEVVEKGIPRKRDTERMGAVLLGHDALKFRSLQTLVIKEWNFHEYGALEATALWHCASTRQANGATLRALHILKSVGFEQLHCKEQAEVTFAIDSIREIVSEVYWDVQDKAAAA